MYHIFLVKEFWKGTGTRE